MSLVKSRQNRTEEPEDGKQPPKPCRKCGDLTPVATLNTYGAQCGACFAAYCRERPRNYRAGKPETQTVSEMKSRLKGRIGNVSLP